LLSSSAPRYRSPLSNRDSTARLRSWRRVAYLGETNVDMIARKARTHGRNWLVAGAFGAVASAATLGTAAVGCAADQVKVATEDPNAPAKAHVETLDHEACDESGHRIESLDTNNDGKTDVKKVYDQASGKEICRITDVDHDGKPDMYEYFDASGALRRREAGYDQSGVIDAIEDYRNGKLAKRELDTTGQHRVDTWDYFDATGKIARRERDSTNDGRVDQWWTFEPGDKVVIAIDRNGDGKPDPADSVTIGGTDEPSSSRGAPAIVDAGPPAPAVYVPAGMDASALPPPPPPLATAAVAAPIDAGAASAKPKAPKKKKGNQ
jgi:hypothetical protein